MVTRRELRASLAGARDRHRWPYLGRAQKRLLLGGIAMWIGAFLPWLVILGQSLRGAPLAVSWALWAGLMTIAGASVRWRGVAALSALLGGGAAVYLSVWQTTKLLGVCVSTQCLPGPGLAVLFGAGVVALFQAYGLFRDRPAA